MRVIINLLITLVLALPVLSGCKKFLDEKSDKQLNTISTLRDLQGLLDRDPVVNGLSVAGLEASCDNYFMTDAGFGLLTEAMRNMYTWGPYNVYDPYRVTFGYDWSYAYDKVTRANNVLEHIDKVPVQDIVMQNDIRGQAYFVRAKAFLEVAWLWALAYDEATANSDLGIPLRLNTNFNEPSVRASVENSYRQIISDFEHSIPLLPVNVIHPVRPSRATAYAFLSRTYLSMRKYEKALLYADSALQLKSSLLNLNTDINVNADIPFPEFNKEVLYESWMSNYLLTSSDTFIDSTLYDSYAANDLRKVAYFMSIGNNRFRFKGSYSGGIFNGPAVDELYLIRAECRARTGNTSGAMNDLNTLLVTRWRTGTYVPFTAADSNEALEIILRERRKELVYRGLRFTDVKRLNKGNAQIIMRRKVNGVIIELPPNDLRYALAIPEDVIELSGMPQNPR